MINSGKPIVLIGFKHVGKSCLGKALATKINKDFIDLDAVLELRYRELTNESLNCRRIVQKHGIDYFRNLESTVLKEVMDLKPGILAVGGGTPLILENRELIAQGIAIQIKARKGLVFERIMIMGRPAFFPEGEDAYDAFIRIWNEREPIYQALADFEIENSGTIDAGIQNIMDVLQMELA